MTEIIPPLSFSRSNRFTRFTRLFAISLASTWIGGCDRPAPQPAISNNAKSTATQPVAPSTAPTAPDIDQLCTRLASAAAAFSFDCNDELLKLIGQSDAALSAAAPSNASANARVDLATLLTRIGRPDRAIAHLQTIVDSNAVPSTQPSSPPQDWPTTNDRAYLALADAFATFNAFTDADRCLRHATRNDLVFDLYSATQPAKSLNPAFDQALEIRVQCHGAAGELGPASVRAELVYNIRRERDGENTARTRLSKIEHWRQRATLGGHLEAEPALIETVNDCTAALGESHPITQFALLVHGECEMRLPGRFAAALAKVEKATHNLIGVVPPGNRYLRTAVNRTIESLEYRREWARSETLIQSVSARLKPNAPFTLPSLRVECARRLAENFQRRNNLAQAKEQIQSTLKLTETSIEQTPDWIDAHAATLQTAADIARREKNFKDANRLIADAIHLRETRSLDDQAPMLAWAQTTRAWILMNEGDLATADDEMTRIVPVLRERLGESDWRTGQARLLLGELHYKQMRLEDAEEDIVYGSRILVGRRGGDEDGIHSLRLCVDYYEMSGNVEMATHYRRLLPESHDHDHDEQSGE